MKSEISRRSVIGTILPATLLGLAIPGRARAADQPRMQAALEALRTAKRELEAATPDKGGHRNAAIRAINNAIVQVERGIAFDRRH